MGEPELPLARVTVDPTVCGGQPCVTGTRIPISIILASLADGETLDTLQVAYPTLTGDDVRAVLLYAARLAEENVWKVGA